MAVKKDIISAAQLKALRPKQAKKLKLDELEAKLKEVNALTGKGVRNDVFTLPYVVDADIKLLLETKGYKVTTNPERNITIIKW